MSKNPICVKLMICGLEELFGDKPTNHQSRGCLYLEPTNRQKNSSQRACPALYSIPYIFWNYDAVPISAFLKTTGPIPHVGLSILDFLLNCLA
jgi:hypothetical protein